MRLEKQGNATKLMECVSFVSSRVIFCQKTGKHSFLGEDFKKCVWFCKSNSFKVSLFGFELLVPNISQVCL